ncbi:MAG: FliM/FliN family flagellar motor switch protein, partial [Thermodesulfovibrionia bacterium]|nr:FliM/FliN family flagellar motor switch protein [Thermodesulfovibrionia bacterium]
DHRWAEVMKRSITDTHVNLTAEIGQANITFADLMKFDIGSIIPLNKSVSDELILKVEDVPKFKGLPGFSKGNQALKVTGTVN